MFFLGLFIGAGAVHLYYMIRLWTASIEAIKAYQEGRKGSSCDS